MAATFVYGVDGAVYFGTKLVSFVNNWSLAINTGVVDTPDMGSSGPVRNYSKYRDFSGTVSGSYRFDPNTTSTVAQEDVTLMFVSGQTASNVGLKLLESSKSMYHGLVVFTNISRGQPAEGVGSWSADWAQQNGPLDWEPDTSS